MGCVKIKHTWQYFETIKLQMGLTSYSSILLPKHSRIISHDGENDYDSAGQAALPPSGSPAVVVEAT